MRTFVRESAGREPVQRRLTRLTLKILFGSETRDITTMQRCQLEAARAARAVNSGTSRSL